MKGVAIRTVPESCGDAREGGGEALTGEYAGRVLSREIRELLSNRQRFGVPTPFTWAEGHIARAAIARPT